MKRITNLRKKSVRIAAMERVAGPERVKILQEKYPEHAETIADLGEADPTGGSQKYLDWATRMVVKADAPDAAWLKVSIKRWHNTQTALKKKDTREKVGPFEKDLNKFKTLEALIAELDRLEPLVRRALANYDVVYEDEDWIAYDVKDKNAMCALANNVGKSGENYWCVTRASQRHYENYATKNGEPRKDVRFIMIHSKKVDTDQYLAYVVDEEIREIKDYRDNDIVGWSEVPTFIFEELGIKYDGAENLGDVDVYVVTLGYMRGEQVFAADNQLACKRYINDDDDAQEQGARIWNASVPGEEWAQFQAGDLEASELSAERYDVLVEVKPKRVERFFLSAYGEEERMDVVLFDHKSRSGITEYIEDNKRLLRSTGYVIWRAQTLIKDIRHGNDIETWEVEDVDVLSETEPHPDSIDDTITIYYAVGVGDAKLSLEELRESDFLRYGLSLEELRESDALRYGGVRLFAQETRVADWLRGKDSEEPSFFVEEIPHRLVKAYFTIDPKSSYPDHVTSNFEEAQKAFDSYTNSSSRLLIEAVTQMRYVEGPQSHHYRGEAWEVATNKRILAETPDETGQRRLPFPQGTVEQRERERLEMVKNERDARIERQKVENQLKTMKPGDILQIEDQDTNYVEDWKYFEDGIFRLRSTVDNTYEDDGLTGEQLLNTWRRDFGRDVWHFPKQLELPFSSTSPSAPGKSIAASRWLETWDRTVKITGRD